MAPSPNLEYQEIAGEIYRQIANALVEKNAAPLLHPLMSGFRND